MCMEIEMPVSLKYSFGSKKTTMSLCAKVCTLVKYRCLVFVAVVVVVLFWTC
jgi:hypothetical protein